MGFAAADDLEKFRRSLAAQDDLIKIVLHMGILSIVGNHVEKRPALLVSAQSLAVGRLAYRSTHGVQGYLDRNSNPTDELNYFVEALTDLVYERLLTRPNMPLQNRGTVHTLPDGNTVDISHTQLHSMPEEQNFQQAADWTEQNLPSQKEAKAQAGKSNHNTIASDINEYLRSMNLDELSDQDREYLSQNNSGTRQLLIDGPSGETADAHDQNYDDISGRWPKPSDAQESSRQRSNFRLSRNPSSHFDFETLSASLELVASIKQSVDLCAKASFSFMHIFTIAPRELLVLSGRIMQYSKLLQAAAEVIRTSKAIGELQTLGWDILRDSKGVMQEVQNIIGKFNVKQGQQFVRAIKWHLNKPRAIAAMEEVESLKSTLTFVLQLHQVNLAERSLDAIRLTSLEISPDLAKDRELRANEDGCKHRCA